MQCEIPNSFPAVMPAASTEELRAWLALWRTPGVGPRSFAKLLELTPQLRDVHALSHTQLLQLGFRTEVADAIRRPDWEAVDADLRWLEAADHHLVRSIDPNYPSRLRDVPGAPPLLFVAGDVDCLRLPQLAIIGSRSPTAGGRDNAFQFAEHLASHGLCITSGLALGIDAAAHQGALAANGYTIAVTGTGLDRVYPARHRELARAISAQGALVSEFPPGTQARAENFPRRNRIISGLSLGTLVVEASLRSGSLITARFALEQGREVYAIPGSIHNPLSKGCHALIRQGAKLVECVADILEELPPGLAAEVEAPAAAETALEEDFDQDYRQVLDALGHDPVPVDLLVQRTGLTPGEVSSILLVLELKGHVTAIAGGRYARAAS
jgi:DNA processing protein